jgi:hypothetical protein
MNPCSLSLLSAGIPAITTVRATSSRAPEPIRSQVSGQYISKKTACAQSSPFEIRLWWVYYHTIITLRCRVIGYRFQVTWLLVLLSRGNSPLAKCWIPVIIRVHF